MIVLSQVSSSLQQPIITWGYQSKRYAPSSQYSDIRACCITCVNVQSLTQLCSPCPHVLHRHCSAQRQQTPSAILRAEEIQILTFDMTFITGLNEWGENLISLLKRESAAPLYPRINAGLLATNSAGNKIPFFTCMPLLQASGGFTKALRKKKHHSPTTSISRALFSSTVVGEDRLTVSSTGMHEKAHWDTQTDVAMQIKCQRFSKFSLWFLKLVIVNHRWEYIKIKKNLKKNPSWSDTWVDMRNISVLYRQLFRFHF